MDEVEQVTRKLTRDSDEFFQLAQVVSLRFNKLLESAVPRVERAKKTVGEMLSITDDEILSAMRKATYSARVTSLHRTINFDELSYEGKSEGYWISFFDGASEFPVFWTVNHVGGQEHSVECPTCKSHSEAKILKRHGVVENISCATCGFVVIQGQKEKQTDRNSLSESKSL